MRLRYVEWFTQFFHGAQIGNIISTWWRVWALPLASLVQSQRHHWHRTRPHASYSPVLCFSPHWYDKVLEKIKWGNTGTSWQDCLARGSLLHLPGWSWRCENRVTNILKPLLWDGEFDASNSVIWMETKYSIQKWLQLLNVMLFYCSWNTCHEICPLHQVLITQSSTAGYGCHAAGRTLEPSHLVYQDRSCQTLHIPLPEPLATTILLCFCEFD